MPTNKISLRTVEEFMEDYVPVYQPLYGLFLARSVAYEPEVGKIDFRRVTAVGDIRAKHITPKDTEIRQLSAIDGKKTFKKYFLATQFTLSSFQNREGVEDVVKQVLDEHQTQADEIFLTGEGTGMGDTINNGLFYSADANYLLEASYEIPSGSTRLSMFYAKVMAEVQKASQIAGRKVVIIYGADEITLMNSLMPNSDRPVRVVLQEALAPFNASVAFMPDTATPAGQNGFIVVNMDQVKMHYIMLPQVWAQGENEEKMYLWFNFLQGSSMLELQAKNAVIRQPTTLAV